MYPFPRRRDGGGCLRRDLTTTLTDDPLLRDDLQTGAKSLGEKKKVLEPLRKNSLPKVEQNTQSAVCTYTHTYIYKKYINHIRKRLTVVRCVGGGGGSGETSHVIIIAKFSFRALRGIAHERSGDLTVRRQVAHSVAAAAVAARP